MSLKVNRYILFLGLIVFTNLQCFYLVDTTKIPTNDIAVLLEALFIIYVYCKCGPNRNEKIRYSFIFALPIILVLTSTYTAYINYGQPIHLGIRAQRHWIMAMLMYFPIVRLIKLEKVRVEQIFSLLDKMMIVYATMVVSQYFFTNIVRFMYMPINSRYGSPRLYISTYFLLISYFYHLNLVLNKRKIKIKDAFIIIITLFIHLFITKSRMSMVMLVGVSVIALLMMKLTGKKLLYISVAVGAVCVFISTSMGQEILDSLFGAASIDAGTVIRDVGRAFYIEKTLSTPLTALFGSGYANLDWGPTVAGIRYLEGINYNDNGIIGLFFYYGFAFVAWMLFSHIKIMKDAWKYEHKDIFFYLLCGLMGIYTLFPYCYVTDISFATVCAIVAGTQKNEQ